jgi:hypothetical protein
MGLFQKHLNGLRGDLLKQEAALTSLEFINRTSPIKPQEGVENAGLSQGAKKVGEAAVDRDIRSIFKPTDYMLAGAVDTAYGSIEAFQKWKNKPLPRGSNDVIRRIWGDQDIENAYKIAQKFMGSRDMSRGLDDIGSLRTVHERERNASRRKGRIASKAAGGPSRDIKGPPYRPYFANANVIEKYIKLRQQMVGKAKSGWWIVISKLGTININGKTQRPTGSKVPQWVRRNAKGSLGFFNRLPDNKKITIINTMGNVNNIAKESGDIVAQVINARNVRLGNNPYMQKAIDKAVSMWNSGQIK